MLAYAQLHKAVKLAYKAPSCVCSRGDALALTAARAGVGGTVVIRSVLVVGCTAVSVLTAVLVGEAVL